MNEKEIQELIIAIIKDSDAFHLTVPQLKKKLPTSLKKELKISAQKVSAKKVMETLNPYFGDELTAYKKGVSQCIGFKLSFRDMIIWQLNKTPNKTSKELKRLLPMKLDDYIETINDLLKNNTIYCKKLTKDHLAGRFALAAKSENTLPNTHQKRKEDFRRAYQIAGGGRPYVYIHKIREQLNWSTDDFDRVLEELSESQIIELQGGNPGLLTEAEKEQSYHDRWGYLRITVTWREPT